MNPRPVWTRDARRETTSCTALVLRFFEGQTLRSVGAAMGTTEDAARARVDRAVAKLGILLKRRGITLSSGALVTILAGAFTAEVPSALASSVTIAALTTSGTATGLTATLIKFMASTKIKAAGLSAG